MCRSPDHLPTFLQVGSDGPLLGHRVHQIDSSQASQRRPRHPLARRCRRPADAAGSSAARVSAGAELAATTRKGRRSWTRPGTGPGKTTRPGNICGSRGWPWDILRGISYPSYPSFFFLLGRLSGRRRGTWPTGACAVTDDAAGETTPCAAAVRNISADTSDAAYDRARIPPKRAVREGVFGHSAGGRDCASNSLVGVTGGPALRAGRARHGSALPVDRHLGPDRIGVTG